MRTCGSTKVTQKFEPHPSSPRSCLEGVPRKLAAEARRPFKRTSGVGGILSFSASFAGIETSSLMFFSGLGWDLEGVAGAGAADMARVIVWVSGGVGVSFRCGAS